MMPSSKSEKMTMASYCFCWSMTSIHAPTPPALLQRIADGMTNKEIARELALSPRTVETYRANVFAKLEVDTLAQLIRHYLLLLPQR